MGTNWKTEEKKMSMSKNIARLAVTAGLTAALSFGGVMAPVTMAFAASTPTVATDGNVAIKEDTYKDTTFKGIKIFSAKVTQAKDGEAWSGDKTLSDIEWANESVMNAVTAAYGANESKPDGFPTGAEAKSAQAWAQFINKHGADVAGNNVNAGSVLDKIAAAVEKAGISEGTDGWVTAGSNGSFDNLATGYWLFVTKSVGKKPDAVAEGNTDTFTSPIFAVVGGSAENLTPKKKVPTVTKAVRDDKEGSSFGDNVFTNPNMAADSRMDQFIDYQLTGTVAGNIDTYSTYKYTFTDNLPKSMTPKFTDEASTTPAVTVKIDGKKVISGYTATFDDSNVLTVDFGDLKVCKGENESDIAVTGNSTVTVEYQAKLDPAKIFENGKDGAINSTFGSLVGKPQKNTVTLTYSNNPHADGTGTTVEHPAYDYTYGIDVTKVGSEAENPTLADVEFTLQEQGDTDSYIKANGTKTFDKKQATLTTDANGKINVVGLDEGTYVLTEVKPAPGYDNSHSKGITFTITRDSLPANDTTVVNPGCTLASGTNEDLVKVAQTNTETADGKVHITVVDQKGSGLPLTGLNGVTFTWIAGGAVLCIGVAHLIRSRKQAEESEQE